MNGHKNTILIVDDVRMNLKMADLILRKELNCKTFLANSGYACLDLLKKQSID